MRGKVSDEGGCFIIKIIRQKLFRFVWTGISYEFQIHRRHGVGLFLNGLNILNESSGNNKTFALRYINA